MTQAINQAPIMCGAPFPLPPGLEPHPLFMGGLGPAVSAPEKTGPEILQTNRNLCQDIATAVEDAVLQYVDSRLTAQVEEMWKSGKEMLCNVEEKQRRKAEEVAEEITRCLEKQRALEAENQQFKQVFANLANQISSLDMALGGAGCMPSPGGTTGNSVAPVASTSQTGGSTSDPFPLASSMPSNAGFAFLPEMPAPSFSWPALGGAGAGSTSATPVSTPHSVAPLSDSVVLTPAISNSPALAEMPRFSFSSQPQLSATPLSLAQALSASHGQQQQQQQQQQQRPTTLSLAAALPPASAIDESSSKGMCTDAAVGVLGYVLPKTDEKLSLSSVPQHGNEVDSSRSVLQCGDANDGSQPCTCSALLQRAVLLSDELHDAAPGPDQPPQPQPQLGLPQQRQQPRQPRQQQRRKQEPQPTTQEGQEGRRSRGEAAAASGAAARTSRRSRRTLTGRNAMAGAAHADRTRATVESTSKRS